MIAISIPSLQQHCEAVIVDLDGTMVDTMGDFAEALNRMLADLQLPAIDVLTIEPMVGKGSEHLLRAVLTHVLAQVHQPGGQPVPATEIDNRYAQAWERYQYHYLAINGRFSRVYDGVEKGLAQWRSKGLKMACLTNKPLSFAEPLLRAKGLRDYFDHVFGGDSFERKKPDPLPLLKTCEALGSKPTQTLMVGDSSNDAEAAHNAGCPVVLVSYGYNHGQPIREVAATGYVDALSELQA
jgi:phosphoglycolate phosphatase